MGRTGGQFEDRKTFEARAECLLDQYAHCTVADDIKNMLSEVLAGALGKSLRAAWESLIGPIGNMNWTEFMCAFSVCGH